MSHTARKRFGQHFLVDQQVIGDIINAVAPRRDASVVEIGPGLGALTGPLLDRLDHLHVIEIDRDIVSRLRQQHAPQRLTIHAGDALAFDFSSLPGDENTRWQVVGNLPYNISTPLLFHLASDAERFADMHFMLQKEVVDRLVAEPGTADYGRLSVMLQYRFVIDWLFDVPPECFDPPPRVDSAVLRMIPRPVGDLNARCEKTLSELVASAFAQRRKMLRNNLKGILKDEDFERLGIRPTARAEELSVADYVRIAGQIVFPDGTGNVLP